MQLLDDDMDELFRNAASDYPLKTGGADWEALRSKLQQAGSRPQGGGMSGTADNMLLKLVILLLLTTIFFIVYTPPLNTGKIPRTGKERFVQQNIADETGNTTEEFNRGDDNIQTSGSVIPDINTIQNNVITENNNINQHNNVTQNNEIRQQKSTTQNNEIEQNSEQLTVGQTANPLKPAKGIREPAVNRNNYSISNGSTVLPLRNQNTFLHQQPVAVAQTSVASGSALPVEYLDGIRYEYTMPATGTTLLRGGNIREPLPSLNEKVQIPKAKPKGTASFQKGLYAGILLSPDITTVKMQKSSKIGYQLGVIAGYRFNNRLAVETGLLWERKYYYSDGKYFSTKKIPVAPDTKILVVDGYCNMFEIPVNVRYNIHNGTKGSWYVNGGMSSYLMKKEAYNYDYYRNGYYGKMDYDYKNSTKNWFSVIHLGVGFERPAGRLGNIRVEPYVKIPVSGIGIGDLPVTSVGLNIGLTRRVR